MDSAAFMVLGNYLQTHRDALADRVTRLALVRPDGIAGAVASGFARRYDKVVFDFDWEFGTLTRGDD